ncbi:ATP-binding cassette domain-containing protein [Bacillus mojavensis]|uniref:ATP-binding cassette domain-containing protein n=1 Tax=Bacillus mojavensis TaxID=72360 RepID=UPI002DBC4F53|nr:ATP-binding cassette domain-containing protein [Bacillus mojavensis]MEC1627444.1 ATP-binding cassette domain-containing protein [Bacillus mojavensis]
MRMLLEASIEQAGYTSRKKVLTDVLLEVRGGELVGLIGANGAGKSTAIKAILGLSQDFKGTIAWNDCSFAYIPEHPSFYEELTLWEHLDLISTLHGIDQSEFEYRSQSLLETFSLDHVKHELPVTFSKGMQQKLMLIQAFLSKPDMYVIDEPFIGLDPISTKRFVDMLKAEKERGAGILMCTHVLDTAEKICDRFYMIDKGSLFLLRQMKQYALVYSLLFTLAKWLLLFFLLLPFIIDSVRVTISESASLLIYTFGLHTVFLSLKQERIRKPRSIWRQITDFILKAVLFACSFLMITFTEWHLLSLVGVMFFIFAYIRSLKKTASFSAFEAEVLEERKIRLALAGLVMMTSQDVRMPRVKDRMRRKPLLFRNSKRIFKKRTTYTIYKELFFKVMLRNGEYARHLYMLLSAFTILTVVSPIFLKVMALLVYTGVCRYVLSLIFDKVMDAPILIGADKESDEYYRARKSCVNTLHYACVSCCFLAAVISFLMK